MSGAAPGLQDAGVAGDSAEDLVAVAYQWLRAVTATVQEAESLTRQVFARAAEPSDDWLLNLPELTRLKILTITVVLRHRRPGSAGQAGSNCGGARISDARGQDIADESTHDRHKIEQVG